MSLDQHVDDVARRMTITPPTGRLRARVVDKLGMQPSTPALRRLPALAGTFVMVFVFGAVWWTLRPAPRVVAPANNPGAPAIATSSSETQSATIGERNITSATPPRERLLPSRLLPADTTLDLARIQPAEISIPLLDEIAPVLITPIPDLVPVGGGD